MKKKVFVVVGTRPNFIKISQFKRVYENYKDSFDLKIIHTGQHSDERMAEVFFKQFNFTPDISLNIVPANACGQMAEIIDKLGKLFENEKPSLVLVVGDVNSTLAAAIAANKSNVKIAHIESGLRSNDRTMPEEINRILTDEITDYFFVTEQSGIDNLMQDERKRTQVYFVGNTMIDTMVAFQHEIQNDIILKKYSLAPQKYILMTMHRPATVDNLEGLGKLSLLLRELVLKYKVIFPIHPRTRNRMIELGVSDDFSNIEHLILTDPLDYFSFQSLIYHSKLIITDSGGIQEESTFYRVPCLTLRPNTERPVTVVVGTNELVPFSISEIRKKIGEIENGNYKKGAIPEKWDGKSSERIFEAINQILKLN